MLVDVAHKKTVREILAEFTTDKNTLGVSFDGFEYVSANDIYDYLKFHYGSFRCSCADDKNDFKALWNHFIRIRHNEIKQIYTALVAEYNPIENYNKTDTTVTPTLTTHIYESGDDLNLHETNKTVSDNATITNTVHGNIGVMTNQSMITDEIKLRTSTNICKEVCAMFFGEYLF